VRPVFRGNWAQAEKAVQMMMRQFADYKEAAPGCSLKIPNLTEMIDLSASLLSEGCTGVQPYTPRMSYSRPPQVGDPTLLD